VALIHPARELGATGAEPRGFSDLGDFSVVRGLRSLAGLIAKSTALTTGQSTEHLIGEPYDTGAVLVRLQGQRPGEMGQRLDPFAGRIGVRVAYRYGSVHG
jgi:hypothetical protein